MPNHGNRAAGPQAAARPRPARAIWKFSLLAVVALVVLSGCASIPHPWQAEVVGPDGTAFMVDAGVLASLDEFAEEGPGVPLERVLWQAGYRSIQRVTLAEPEGARHEFQWAAVADDAWWLENGRISVEGAAFPVSRLRIEPSALRARVQAHITNVAPTAAAALGLPAPAQATGRALEVSSADHVLLLFLDGFGYVRYTEASGRGLTPNLAALGEPLLGLTVYPPCTSVATAALLTGAPPAVNGVDRRGIRKTETETLFDVASAAGLRVVAIEGEALPFNLRNAETSLSGDRDGDGHTDDNVLANALAALEDGMPDLFYVHFHGIDDAGHTYGPDAPEEEALIQKVDAAVGELLARLPSKTLVIIFADHGMHRVEEEGRLGNHGHLIDRDMLIPIWTAEK